MARQVVEDRVISAMFVFDITLSSRPRRREPNPSPSVAPSHAQLYGTVSRIRSSEYLLRILPGDDDRMKHIVALSAVVFLLLLWSCGGDGSPTTPTPIATSITLSVTSLSLASLGATSQLSATVKDQNGATMSGASGSHGSYLRSLSLTKTLFTFLLMPPTHGGERWTL